MNKELNTNEKDYIVNLIMAWINKELNEKNLHL